MRMSLLKKACIGFGLVAGGGSAAGTYEHVFHEEPLENVSTTIDIHKYDLDKNKRINGFEPLTLLRSEFDVNHDGRIDKDEKQKAREWLKTFKHTFYANVLHTRNRISEVLKQMGEYSCLMHPEAMSDLPGKCSACNTDLVKKEE